MPKISVILPAYNHEKYISYTLDSILNQEMSDLEIIAVNDGSTDKTGYILDYYAEKDSRIKVFHKKNGGVVSASNEAMEHATGQWLAWCGSDDIVPPNAYRDLLKKSKNVDVVIGEFSEITDYGDKIRVRTQRWRRKNCFDALFAMPAMWSKIIRRSIVVENNLFFPDVKLCEDLIFLADIAALRPRYKVIYNDIYNYRNNPKEISQSMTHTYSLDLFKAHIAGRIKVLEICKKANIGNGKDYVFLDSIKYVSDYLLQMDIKDIEEAMVEIKKLLERNTWDQNKQHFENVFGVKYDSFIEYSGAEYIYTLMHEDPLKSVLRKFRVGDIGLQYIFKCIKAWLSFKTNSNKRK